MITSASINYPKEFSTPESRKDKKFKYYKIEPYEFKNEKKGNEQKEIRIGKSSNRIAYTANSEKFFNEIYNLVSFDDIINETLSEYNYAATSTNK